MANLLLLVLLFPLSILVTYVLMRAIGFLQPPQSPTDDNEHLRGRAERVKRDAERVRERSRRLERMLTAEEDLFKKGGHE